MPTVGVLVTLPEPALSELDGYRFGIGDQNPAEVPSHITLLPPTEVDDGDLVAIEEHLATAAAGHAPYRVHLRGTATFQPVSPVVFVVLAEGIARTEQLAAAVRSGPLDVELAYPYHPHVTVAYDVDQEVLDRAFEDFAGYDRAFDVAEFHLYTQGADGRWRHTRRFDLGEA
ncbi:2'-5' RNA ligase family protein [Nocardioides panacisoli]|uniref:2'-5' RNA ligase family protein n=1 Tax=Nocardioides panacisoli TaxID=627624 RepID=UPI001C63A118|nr:2'-5' RNA ligase family protein [Nocardioides panacisoli]QYJ02516.1 2'-5' RNA ligase family protein [Nocardioides panacisoli]